MSDETLDGTAPDEGQPVLEAASQAPVDTADGSVEPPASGSPEQPAFASRTYAGKYQSPDELERAYLDSQREASRMAGELSALKRTETSATPAQPKWQQLEGERNKWAQQLRRQDLDESQRWQADEQVRLYDREIAYERAKSDITQTMTRSTAESTLERDSQELLSQYSTDLNNEASPLFQAALARYQQLVSAGYPDTINTKALAVSYAAVKSGAGEKRAVQSDRSAMLKTLNQQVKKAVVAGAGAPAPVQSNGTSAKDIERMTPAEFAKYERMLLGV